MVPSHGHLCQTEWHTQKNNRLPTPQPPETHHTQSPFHQARSVPQGKKTVFDAWNGYHSVPLHPDDRHYTTFITPWGCYRYHMAPQGYIASGDGYTRRYDKITSSITSKTKCMDDTLLWSNTIEESFFQPQTGWTSVVNMGSPSTWRSFVLLKTRLNSQASKLPMTPYIHARGTSGPSPTSLDLAACVNLLPTRVIFHPCLQQKWSLEGHELCFWNQ